MTAFEYTKIRDLDDWLTKATLYKLTPAAVVDGAVVEYIIVSTADIPHVGPETLVFSADATGATSLVEIGGIRGTFVPDAAPKALTD